MPVGLANYVSLLAVPLYVTEYQLNAYHIKILKLYHAFSYFDGLALRLENGKTSLIAVTNMNH
jgi:hypothetical protein